MPTNRKRCSTLFLSTYFPHCNNTKLTETFAFDLPVMHIHGRCFKAQSEVALRCDWGHRISFRCHFKQSSLWVHYKTVLGFREMNPAIRPGCFTNCMLFLCWSYLFVCGLSNNSSCTIPHWLIHQRAVYGWTLSARINPGSCHQPSIIWKLTSLKVNTL